VNRTRRLMVTTAVVLLLSANSPMDMAGIQGSGKSAAVRGPVTGFGSIFVDGVEYATSNATVIVDDQPGSQAQLHVGQIVTLQGTVNDDGRTGTATEVTFSGTVAGPVTQVNVANNTFVVLGQTVQVTGATLGIQLADLSALAPGSPVEVSGCVGANGEIVASYVDLAPAGTNLRVTGTVQGVNAAAQTFSINGLTVNYGAAQLGVPLANGNVVAVQGAVLDGAGELVAAQVNAAPSLEAVAGEFVDLSGLITGVTSLLDFVVQGQAIIIDPLSTKLVLHGIPLGLNVEVTVKGTMTASGAVQATEVEVKAH
jgi:uncharacterized protein DUF5666